MKTPFVAATLGLAIAALGCASNPVEEVPASQGEPSNIQVTDTSATVLESTGHGGTASATQTSRPGEDETGPATPTATGIGPATTSASASEQGQSDTATGTAPTSEPDTASSDTDRSVDADKDGWTAAFDCNDSNSSVHRYANENTDNGVDDDCDGATDERAGKPPRETSPVCDEQGFAVEFLPVRLMFLVDMSGSMEEMWPNTKEKQAKAALTSLLENPAFSGVEFGLDGFPDDKTCGYEVPPLRDAAPDNQDAIIDALPKLTPHGLTPLYCAMHNFLDPTFAPGFSADGASRFLLVVSDGKANCSKTDCTGDGVPSLLKGDFAALTKDLLAAGMRSMVVGFDPLGSNVDPDQLNEIAANGGSAFTSFILAKDQEELEDAFESMASSIASCFFELKDADASADPEKVNFYFDGSPDAIPFDDGCATGKGWRWADADHKKVEFCEQPCSALQSGEVTDVQATFGCPTAKPW